MRSDLYEQLLCRQGGSVVRQTRENPSLPYLFGAVAVEIAKLGECERRGSDSVTNVCEDSGGPFEEIECQSPI